MSFVITIKTGEGIVMAADSRLTLTLDDPSAPTPITPPPSAGGSPIPTAAPRNKVSVPQSDAQQKLFLVQNRVGISTFGNASIGTLHISGFIESFILTLKKDVSPQEVSEELLTYFKNIDPSLATSFHVAGYNVKNGEVSAETWGIDIANSTKQEWNAGNQGAAWGGMSDIMSRMVMQVYQKDAAGNYNPMPFSEIPWNWFTLQDPAHFP